MERCRRRLSWSCGGPGSTVELGVCRCHREVLVVSVPLLARVALSNKRHCLSKMYNCIGAQGGDPYAPPKLGNAGRTHHAPLRRPATPPTVLRTGGRAGPQDRPARSHKHSALTRCITITINHALRATRPQARKGPKTKQNNTPNTRGQKPPSGIDPAIAKLPVGPQSRCLLLSNETVRRLARDIAPNEQYIYSLSQRNILLSRPPAVPFTPRLAMSSSSLAGPAVASWG